MGQKGSEKVGVLAPCIELVDLVSLQTGSGKCCRRDFKMSL